MSPIRHNRTVHLFAWFALVSAFLLLLTFLTASSLGSAPNARIVKKLNLNDRLTVKGKGCQPQVQSQADAKIVIRCVKNKAQRAEPNTPDAKITLALRAGDKLIVKRKTCRLQVTSLSNTRVWIICDKGPLAPIVPDTTKPLSSDTTQYLTSVSPDGATFTFSQATDQLNALQVGDIMVSNPAQAAPDGFLRKVDSIQNNGGQIVVQTQATTIADAVQQGEISVSQVLQPTNLERATFAKGVTMVKRPDAPNSFYLQLNDVVLYDEDGNTSTTNDQIVGNGNLTLDPRFDFRLKVENFQLKELYFTTTAQETSNLTIESKVVASASKETTLATYPLGPLFLTIGPVPVTVYPIITITAGIDGSIYAGVSTGVTQSLTETAGVSYANGAWSPIQQFTNQFQYNVPTLSAGLAIKGYTGAKLKILFYGSVGPDIGINAYLKLEANSLETPWWKLYGGLEAPVGISIDIFSHVIAGWSAVVIDFRKVIAQAETQSPTEIPTPTATQTSTTTPTSAPTNTPTVTPTSILPPTNTPTATSTSPASSGSTMRVSVDSDGTQGNGTSGYYGVSLSANARYVAFASSANNFVNGDTNGQVDIFFYDMQMGQTVRASIASDGTQGDADSVHPSLSADGRYVAFDSRASNLVSGDTNNFWDDVFVHDMETGQTIRVSVASNGTQGNSWSSYPSISADGRYVAFESGASNLVPDDTNGAADVFVHDNQTGQTTRVSIASNGAQGNGGTEDVSISADGRYVAFADSSSNLVSGDTNSMMDLFVHDMQTGLTTRVSIASDGTQANSWSRSPTLSADGRYVAFISYASNLVPNDTNNFCETNFDGVYDDNCPDVYVHDRQTGVTTRVSVASDGSEGNNWSSDPFLSADGRHVGFDSSASNFVSGDTNGMYDVFIRDMQSEETFRVSVASDGSQGTFASGQSSLSADGRYVAFASNASNLVSGDTNHAEDVFVHQRW